MTSRRAFLRTLGVGLAGLALGGPGLMAQSQAGARTHMVVRGDTLGKIAARYGVTVTALKIANKLKTDRIQVGQRLVIPGAGDDGVLKEVIAATLSLKIQRGRWRYVVVHHSGIEAGNARS